MKYTHANTAKEINLHEMTAFVSAAIHVKDHTAAQGNNQSCSACIPLAIESIYLVDQQKFLLTECTPAGCHMDVAPQSLRCQRIQYQAWAELQGSAIMQDSIQCLC